MLNILKTLLFTSKKCPKISLRISLRTDASLNSLDSSSIILGTIDSTSRHNGIATDLLDKVGILGSNTAINFQPGVDTTGIAHFLELPHLFNLAVDEFLATESGVDRHEKDEINILNEVLEDRQGGSGVEHNT